MKKNHELKLDRKLQENAPKNEIKRINDKISWLRIAKIALKVKCILVGWVKYIFRDPSSSSHAKGHVAVGVFVGRGCGCRVVGGCTEISKTLKRERRKTESSLFGWLQFLAKNPQTKKTIQLAGLLAFSLLLPKEPN